MNRRLMLFLPSLFVATGNDAWSSSRSLRERIARLQNESGSQIGVCIFDSATRRMFSFNADLRFAMASTFKLLLAAAILRQVDLRQIKLSQELPLNAEQIVANSPVTNNIANGFITIEQACEAVIRVSDNTAANLLLDRIGGPPAYTKFARMMGDRITHLDRVETELNSNESGDLRDTTTPRAMVNNMRRVLLENVLSPASKERLIQWLIQSSTGHERIRAGLPHDWRVGDKTGTGGHGAVNDLAIFWPKREKPVLLAIYLSGSTKSTSELNALHAQVTGALVKGWLNA